jgi:Uma2 family endonuclease
MNMSVETLISVEEYLKTSYSPDREYRDGVLTERNVGDNAHSLLQIQLAMYCGKRRKQWQIRPYTELRIRVRADWYPIPDVCIYPLPAPKERFPSTMPLLWVEILSDDDRMIEVWEKAADLVACGVPYVWIINPHTLESQLLTPSGGPNQVPGKTLQIPGTPIVIPLLDVMEE